MQFDMRFFIHIDHRHVVGRQIMTPVTARFMVARNELGQELGLIARAAEFPYEYLTGRDLAWPAALGIAAFVWSFARLSVPDRPIGHRARDEWDR